MIGLRLGVRRFGFRKAERALGSLLIFVSLVCTMPVCQAQSPSIEPFYANGEIHCPDGNVATYKPPTARASQGPGVDELDRACLAISILATKSTAEPLPADPTASIRHDPLAKAGELSCPDGTTRPWSGGQPSELVVNMACNEPAGVAAERHRQATIAVETKDKEARLQAALRGDEGVAAGLKASWEAGSLDYLLSFRLTWFIGIVLTFLFVTRLFRSKR